MIWQDWWGRYTIEGVCYKLMNFFAGLIIVGSIESIRLSTGDGERGADGGQAEDKERLCEHLGCR